MKKLLSLTIALSLFVGTGAPAFATTSTIDPNSPRYQDGLTASLFRTQFDRAYNDINALWAYAVNLASTTASTISGDASGTASSGILPLTLNTVNSNVGSFGSASAVPTLTVNGKGLVTAAGSSAVVAPASTLSGTTLATGVTGSSLTSAAGGAFASGAYAAAYSLPTASTSVLGGVKVDGSTITIGSTGIISSTGSSLTNPTITGTATINPAINSPALTLSGNTDTASTNVLNITETWNNAATTFDAPIFENITNTASNTNSKVMDLWVNGSSVFGVGYNGTMATAGSLYIGGPAGMIISDNRATLALRNGGTVLSSPAGGVFQLGAADSASPIAQTLSAQSTVGGTTNTAGQNLTIAGSRGTGTGAGGSIVLQTAPAAGGSGSTQNALVTALTIDATSLISGIKETLSGLMTAQSFTATGTGADILPVGTTAQRPSSTAEGMLRDNTTSHQIEAFLNGTWSAVGSGGGGSPGGAVGSIQYNNSGAFGGLAIGTGISSYGGTLSTTSTALRTVYSTVDVISSTDGGVGVNYLSSSNTAVSIAAATTTGYGLGFATVLDNSGTGTVTLTPTTSTINYGTFGSVASITIAPNQGCTIYSDGTNYNADPSSCSALDFPAYFYPATADTSSTKLGKGALAAQTAGTLYNTAVGMNAMLSSTSGSNNTAYGNQAMYANLTGSNNTAIGMGAMGIGTTATSNTAIGLYALQHSNGSSNFGVGANAGQNVTTGANNFFLGNSAGNNVTTGSANFIMGPYNAVSATGSFEVNINNDIRGYSNGFYSASIGTGWGTGAVMTNWAGSFVFQITVGTTPSTPAVVNFPIAMPHGFACDATDTTTLSEVTSVVPTSTTSSTVNFFSRTAGTALAPTASDVVVIRCFGG